MSNPKRTPTPWHQDGFVVKDSQNNIVAYIESERSDAARIVQCVNEYDGLIETIESLRAENAELIEALRSIIEANESEELDLIQTVYLMTGIAQTTLAKYEKP